MIHYFSVKMKILPVLHLYVFHLYLFYNSEFLPPN
nr:MAG TPA: hypothetical protein [Caudoviricetes sp.]